MQEQLRQERQFERNLEQLKYRFARSARELKQTFGSGIYERKPNKAFEPVLSNAEPKAEPFKPEIKLPAEPIKPGIDTNESLEGMWEPREPINVPGIDGLKWEDVEAEAVIGGAALLAEETESKPVQKASWVRRHLDEVALGGTLVVLAGLITGLGIHERHGNHPTIATTSAASGDPKPETPTTIFVGTTEASTVKLDAPKNNLDANRIYNFPADTLIFGDALVGNNADDLQRVFDNNEHTGAITFLVDQGAVMNPVNPETGKANGLSARAVDPKANFVTVLENAEKEMEKQHESDPNFTVQLFLKQGNDVFRINIEGGKIVTLANGN